MSYAILRPTDEYEIVLQAEETANDSDKAFTVPAVKTWQILSIWIELITTATVGDRQIEVLIRDGSDDTIMQLQAGIVQAASATQYYLFAPGIGDLTALRDSSYLTTPIPPLVLPAGWDIRIWDNNAVDAAADDMVVQMMVLEQK